ncbi:hypothetical protein M0804_014770 [Polistes exclamans]|nr:hypothetical protein M0804_014770 [Polistes exclamans]
MDTDKVCSICDEALECASLAVVPVKEKGLRYAKATIKSLAAKAAKLKSLSTSSAETPSTSVEVFKSEPMEIEFNFRDLCLICAQPWGKLRKKGCVIQNDYMKQRSKEIEADFQLIAEHIKDSQKGKLTLTELLYLKGSKCFSREVLYRKLIEYFRDDIHILQQQGRETLIIYKVFSTNKLCGDWYCDPDSLNIKQQEAIVNTAAQIVRKNIENHDYNNNLYPPPAKFLHSVQRDIPPLLRVFKDQLTISNSLKNDDNDEEQKYFVQRSFCVSYYQLQQYEASIIMDPPKFVLEDDICVQHVFNNIDYNDGTLDSNNTHQCLGSIAIYTPEKKISYESRTKKLKSFSKISAATVASQKIVQIIPWTDHSNGLENIKYGDTTKLFSIDSPVMPAAYSTYLWAKHCNIQNVPSWKGFMEILTADNKTYDVSKIVCLPFINQSPFNMNTIYTAISTALVETRRINQKTCFVTFDQPLYYKARAIVAAS